MIDILAMGMDHAESRISDLPANKTTMGLDKIYHNLWTVLSLQIIHI
jgi:hypothetical protein